MLGRARARVARARRRPRGAGDREHRQRATRSRPASTSCSSAADKDALREQSRRTQRRRAAAHRVAQQVWKPVIAAVNGVCAGGGLHFVADADIVIARRAPTFLDPHVSVGQVERVRDDRAGAEVADGADPAHGARRSPRAHHRRAGAPARHPQPGRRPARAAARRGRRSWPRRSPATRPPRWPRPSGRCGARSRPGLTDACRAGAQRARRRCGATPTRTRARWPSPRSATADWQPLEETA